MILLMLLFALVFGGAGVAQIWGWFRRRNWEVIEGRVCANTKVRGDEDGPLYRPEIEFTVGGELVRFAPEDYRARAESEIGETRQVWRNPKTGECWESGGSRVFATLICLAIGAFALAAMYWIATTPPDQGGFE